MGASKNVAKLYDSALMALLHLAVAGCGQRPRMVVRNWLGELSRRLAASIVEEKPPAAGMDEALRSTLLCLGIDRALDEGKVVELQSLWQRAGIR